MTGQRLAIVIPCYKAEYLARTLESIATQTNHNFTLYVCDDASPFDISTVVKAFEKRLNLVYNRFSENLGGTDLVRHWSRCVNQVKDEEWIWLFSDDDIMEPACVEAFYRAVNQFPGNSLFHFNVKVVDGNDRTIEETKSFPEDLSCRDFFCGRITGSYHSYVVEFIFSKNIYEECQGFQNFDLAWNSDDATWIKFSKQSTIKTIAGPRIQWRFSGTNISSITADSKIMTRKVQASIDFIKWATEFFGVELSSMGISNFTLLKARVLKQVSASLSLREQLRLSFDAVKQLNYKNMKLGIVLFIAYNYVKKRVRL